MNTSAAFGVTTFLTIERATTGNMVRWSARIRHLRRTWGALDFMEATGQDDGDGPPRAISFRARFAVPCAVRLAERDAAFSVAEDLVAEPGEAGLALSCSSQSPPRAFAEALQSRPTSQDAGTGPS